MKRQRGLRPAAKGSAHWEYATRSAHRANLDPVRKPWESPYAVFGGNPIMNNDVNGDDWYKGKDGSAHYEVGKLSQQEMKDHNYIKYLGNEFIGKDEKGSGVMGSKDGIYSYSKNLKDVIIKASQKDPQSFAKYKQRQEIERWKKVHEEGYGPKQPNPPDAFGVNVGGSFMFAGGATGELSVGYLKGEGIFLAWTVGGGVGYDLGAGASIFTAYNQNPSQLNMRGYLGQDWQTGAQYGIGMSWAGDLAKEQKTGKTVIGRNWQSYEFSVGAEVSGFSKVTYSNGVSFMEAVKYFQQQQQSKKK